MCPERKVVLRINAVFQGAVLGRVMLAKRGRDVVAVEKVALGDGVDDLSDAFHVLILSCDRYRILSMTLPNKTVLI